MLFYGELLELVKSWDFICKLMFSSYNRAKTSIQSTYHLWIAKTKAIDAATLRQDAP